MKNVERLMTMPKTKKTKNLKKKMENQEDLMKLNKQ